MGSRLGLAGNRVWIGTAGTRPSGVPRGVYVGRAMSGSRLGMAGRRVGVGTTGGGPTRVPRSIYVGTGAMGSRLGLTGSWVWTIMRGGPTCVPRSVGLGTGGAMGSRRTQVESISESIEGR